MEIGEKIKIARNNKGFTQEELANQVNVSRTAVSNWENGRNYPDLKTLIQISDTLNMSIDKLLKDDSEFIKKIESDSKELKELKEREIRKNVLSKISLILSFLISIFLWGIYLFFYNPYLGAFPLLGCFCSGSLGIIAALFIKNKVAKICLITINFILMFSFPILLLIALLNGF
ncbi:helix-turn-helix domain-containing protein [Enterococcus faecalis]|uniref:helix-turn-helix domain-containing protein n=1 Tax=Enterococcus faecalis TaxID=1351 RepID=UPI001928143C|nr:helix-turn-helix domain-containing protein [Enterococcus faecalis]MCO5542108.1 helix-turn-helix domain-containing protein [Enterococcus faecalis]